MSKLIDLTGQRFGRLTVVSRAENAKGGNVRWNCSCECGGNTTTNGSSIRSGHTTSCGCYQRESAAEIMRSLRGRDYVQFVGINDADYDVRHCAIYKHWCHMLNRCYDPKQLAKRPTYNQCTVSEEFKIFSLFREWVLTQGDITGLHLDKDIIEVGSKEYSADTCCFVTHAVNSLLVDRAAKRGKYPQGVYFVRSCGKYKASINVNGKRKHLGYYPTVQAAENAYNRAKAFHIAEAMHTQTNIRVIRGLYRHAIARLEAPTTGD